jgi:hypothetical protein
MKWIFIFLFPFTAFAQYYEVEVGFTDTKMSDVTAMEGYIDISDEYFTIASGDSHMNYFIYRRSIGFTTEGKPFTQFELSDYIVRRTSVNGGFLFYIHNRTSGSGIFLFTNEYK